MLNKYSDILLKILTQKKITKEENSLLSKDFSSFLNKASENRLEFFFLGTIKKNYKEVFKRHKLEKAYKEGEKRNSIFLKTISVLKDTLSKKNHTIFKTFYAFPTITSDIDILFFEREDYDTFVKDMKGAGFLYKKDDNLKGSLAKPRFLKCEPHLDITWHGMNFISKDFIKKNLIEKRIGQSIISIPNNQATFAISLAHILFDCQYLSMRDYLVLKKIVQDKSVVQACIGQAEKFGWRSGAEYIVSILTSKELFFPVWIPITKAFTFFANKLIFDFKKKHQNHFTTEGVFFPLIFYIWKRARSKFSKKIYRNSWLY